MIVCSCNAISDSSVKACVNSENCPRTPGAVYRCLGCRPCCGRCYTTVRAIIDDALGQASQPAPLAMAAAEPDCFVARLDDHRHTHQHGDCDEACAICAAAA